MAKDGFGHGIESGHSEQQVRQLLDSVKNYLNKKNPVPEELSKQLLSINPNDYYGGFFSPNTDFLVELDTFQNYLRGNYQKNYHNDRYTFGETGELLLGKGETPEDHLLKYFPPKDGYGYGTEKAPDNERGLGRRILGGVGGGLLGGALAGPFGMGLGAYLGGKK